MCSQHNPVTRVSKCHCSVRRKLWTNSVCIEHAGIAQILSIEPLIAGPRLPAPKIQANGALDKNSFKRAPASAPVQAPGQSNAKATGNVQGVPDRQHMAQAQPQPQAAWNGQLVQGAQYSAHQSQHVPQAAQPVTTNTLPCAQTHQLPTKAPGQAQWPGHVQQPVLHAHADANPNMPAHGMAGPMPATTRHQAEPAPSAHAAHAGGIDNLELDDDGYDSHPTASSNQQLASAPMHASAAQRSSFATAVPAQHQTAGERYVHPASANVAPASVHWQAQPGQVALQYKSGLAASAPHASQQLQVTSQAAATAQSHWQLQPQQQQPWNCQQHPPQHHYQFAQQHPQWQPQQQQHHHNQQQHHMVHQPGLQQHGAMQPHAQQPRLQQHVPPQQPAHAPQAWQQASQVGWQAPSFQTVGSATPGHTVPANAYGAHTQTTAAAAGGTHQAARAASNHTVANVAPAPPQRGNGGAVTKLQNWGLHPEPQQGGRFDQHFEWSRELYSVNQHHFKNSTFRGTQEQACFCWPFSVSDTCMHRCLPFPCHRTNDNGATNIPYIYGFESHVHACSMRWLQGERSCCGYKMST